jgi:hypothetical protein
MATTVTLRRYVCTFLPAVFFAGALVTACADDGTNPIPIVPPYVAPEGGPDGGTPAPSDSGGSTFDGASDGGEDAPPTPRDGAPIED